MFEIINIYEIWVEDVYYSVLLSKYLKYFPVLKKWAKKNLKNIKDKEMRFFYFCQLLSSIRKRNNSNFYLLGSVRTAYPALSSELGTVHSRMLTAIVISS